MGIHFTMFFLCLVSFLKEKYKRVKKKELLEKYEKKCFSGIHE